MYIFFAVFLIAVIGLHVFSAGTFYYFFPSKITKILLWLMPLAGTLLIMSGFALQRKSESWLNEPVILAAYYWIGVLFIIFSVSFVIACGVVALGWLKIAVPPWLGRAGLVVSALFIILAVIGGQRTPEIKKINLKAAGLPVEKLSIAQISDSHIGIGVSVKRVRKMVEEINALEPDLILITGDFYEGGKKLRQQEIDALKGLKAKYGVYGSMGNHEFYAGLGNSLDFYEAAGVKPLRQATVRPLPGLAVSGVDDFNAAHISAGDFSNFLNTLNPKDYNILMEHEPRYFETAQDKVNLMLCGHTHRGQIFPFNWLVRLRYKHVYGLFKYGGTNYYVTSGVFYWGPPMRLFTKNEIPFITIERE
ncbi:MAG: metallophosphoesterase [Elusimicrobium sp.]|jgi:predicted MPP superfamily phosphohydrolase|nr:metallophosphoesterase [Elusimicrobium sp.]